MLEGILTSKSSKSPVFWGYVSFTPEILVFLKNSQSKFHLSNVALARVLGVHSTTLKKWLDGRIASCSPENFQNIKKLLQGDFDDKLQEITRVDVFLERVKELYGENIRFQYALLELFRELGRLYLQIRSIPRAARVFVGSLRKFLDHFVLGVFKRNSYDFVNQLLLGKEIPVLNSHVLFASSGDLQVGWEKALHQHRLAVHLSQNDLADLLGVDWTTIRNWENRKACAIRSGNIAKIKIFLEGRMDAYMLNHYHYIVATREVQEFLPVALRRLLERTRALLRKMLLQGKEAVCFLFQELGRILDKLRNFVQDTCGI